MIDKTNFDKTNAWPFVEAKKLLRERKSNIEKKNKIVLQTGYGPSGLPHIGTFGEVARTTMIVNALNHLTDIPKEIITFSDDMDGLRKVPENVPNQEKLKNNLHKPLTDVPDPFEKFSSFGEHNNNMLKQFLDNFKFKYSFKSSTELYKSGYFNDTLKLVLENYEKIMEIILPTLGKERQKTYSPFLPICPETGKVIKTLGKSNPSGFAYELFLDEKGEKISKSKGNGVTIDEWLNYASPQSLSLYMYQNPKRAKKLYKEVVPKAVDEYLDFIEKGKTQNDLQKLMNPVWHVHNGSMPEENTIMTFSMLLNLVETSNADSKQLLWKFVKKYKSEINENDHPIFDNLIEKVALKALIKSLDNCNDKMAPEDIQTNIFTVGKENGYKENLREWFKLIYEVVFGDENGPRMGFFISFFGVNETKELIRKKVENV